MSEPSIDHRLLSQFIVVEGVDGSGKTTQAALLAEWLREQGYSVILTREPGGTALAERLRGILMDPDIACSPRAELLMMLAARAQHVADVIAPALLAGSIVISDRFSLSSLAYQGYGRGLPLNDVRMANAVATAGVQPGLTILVDVDLDVSLGRIGARKDRFEGEGRAFLQRVIDGYRQLATEDPSIVRVDGTENITSVQEAIRRVVRPILDRLPRTGGYAS